MADGRKANIFGIRHLSPAGAFYVRAYFDRVKPQLILIEGPSDFNEMLPSLVDPQVKPPMAIMAYKRLSVPYCSPLQCIPRNTRQPYGPRNTIVRVGLWICLPG